MSRPVGPHGSAPRPARFSTIVLTFAQWLCVLGCLSPPVIIPFFIGYVHDLAERLKVPDRAALESWVVVGSLIVFVLSAGLAIVFKQARAMAHLLQDPEVRRLLPMSKGGRDQRADSPGGLEALTWVYIGMVAGLAGLAIDFGAGTAPWFSALGFLGGFFLAPIVWGMTVGIAEAKDKRGQGTS